MARRRAPNVFGLAFLDAMFCGFGAVILLYMIIDHNTVTRREEIQRDLLAEAENLEKQVVVQTKQLIEAKQTLHVTEQARTESESQAHRLSAELETMRGAHASVDQDALARIERINKLKLELRSLEQDTARLKAAAEEQSDDEQRPRQFVGEGDRQYLTGLKMGGDRILILLDASASMLADTLVNIILRRNLPDAKKMLSDKWQRAVATVDWLTTQLPLTSKYQIYTFSVEARPVLDDTAGRWLEVREVKTLNRAVETLYDTVPHGGTNLYQAFGVTKTLSPPPDNVFLITDGLPTLGRSKPSRGKVSGRQRLRLFTEGVRALPSAIPINVILFPMEGDPMAASAFWKLAVATRGSLVSPAEDWP